MPDLDESRKATNDAVRRYGFEPGKMQWLWRGFEGKPPLPAECPVEWPWQCCAALLDALVTQGSVPAWDGDGLGCAMQIVLHFAKRAEQAEAKLKAFTEGTK